MNGHDESRAVRVESYVDPDLGAVSVAYDAEGSVIASASSGIADGVYIAVDESLFFAASGHLLPMQAWEEALLEEDDD